MHHFDAGWSCRFAWHLDRELLRATARSLIAGQFPRSRLDRMQARAKLFMEQRVLAKKRINVMEEEPVPMPQEQPRYTAASETEGNPTYSFDAEIDRVKRARIEEEISEEVKMEISEEAEDIGTTTSSQPSGRSATGLRSAASEPLIQEVKRER